jgi:hypothetical protein
MGIRDYDKLIAKYYDCLGLGEGKSRAFTRGDMFYLNFNIASKSNLDTLKNTTSCEDLEKYSRFFGGEFQTFDIIPKDIVALYGSRINKCDPSVKRKTLQSKHSKKQFSKYHKKSTKNPMRVSGKTICRDTTKQHLARFHHSNNSIPWYYNLVNYIEEIKAQKCASNSSTKNGSAKKGGMRLRKTKKYKSFKLR